MEALRHSPTAGDVVVTGVLTRLTGLPGIGRVGIALTEGGGRRLRFTSSDRDADALEWCHIDAFDDVPLTSVARSGETVAGTLEALAARFPAFVANQAGTATRAIIAVPLSHDGTTLGGLVAFVRDESALHRLTEAVASAAADAARGLGRTFRATEAPADAPGSFLVDGTAGVGAARRRLRDLLTERGIAHDAIDDAVTCLSELLTNAVIHTAAPAHVRIDLDADLLHVSVRDHGNDLGRRPGRVDSDDALRVHGRGLEIVESLSSRWGHRQVADGTTAWFELDLRHRRTSSPS